jgi:hypothetical protein
VTVAISPTVGVAHSAASDISMNSSAVCSAIGMNVATWTGDVTPRPAVERGPGPRPRAARRRHGLDRQRTRSVESPAGSPGPEDDEVSF